MACVKLFEWHNQFVPMCDLVFLINVPIRGPKI
jgi:hypothetical protein